MVLQDNKAVSAFFVWKGCFSFCDIPCDAAGMPVDAWWYCIVYPPSSMFGWALTALNIIAASFWVFVRILIRYNAQLLNLAKDLVNHPILCQNSHTKPFILEFKSLLVSSLKTGPRAHAFSHTILYKSNIQLSLRLVGNGAFPCSHLLQSLSLEEPWSSVLWCWVSRNTNSVCAAAERKQADLSLSRNTKYFLQDCDS